MDAGDRAVRDPMDPMEVAARLTQVDMTAALAGTEKTRRPTGDERKQDTGAASIEDWSVLIISFFVRISHRDNFPDLSDTVRPRNMVLYVGGECGIH